MLDGYTLDHLHQKQNVLKLHFPKYIQRKKKKKACLAGTQKRGKEEGEQGPDHAAALFSANWFFFLYHKGSGSRQVNCSELAVHLE